MGVCVGALLGAGLALWMDLRLRNWGIRLVIGGDTDHGLPPRAIPESEVQGEFGHRRSESGLQQAQGGEVSSEGQMGSDLGQASDPSAAVGGGAGNITQILGSFGRWLASSCLQGLQAGSVWLRVE